MNEKLAYSLKEAANALGVSTWTLRKMVREGRITVTRFSRKVSFERSELERLIADGRERAEKMREAKSPEARVQ